MDYGLCFQAYRRQSKSLKEIVKAIRQDYPGTHVCVGETANQIIADNMFEDVFEDNVCIINWGKNKIHVDDYYNYLHDEDSRMAILNQNTKIFHNKKVFFLEHSCRPGINPFIPRFWTSKNEFIIDNPLSGSPDKLVAMARLDLNASGGKGIYLIYNNMDSFNGIPENAQLITKYIPKKSELHISSGSKTMLLS